MNVLNAKVLQIIEVSPETVEIVTSCLKFHFLINFKLLDCPCPFISLAFPVSPACPVFPFRPVPFRASRVAAAAGPAALSVSRAPENHKYLVSL